MAAVDPLSVSRHAESTNSGGNYDMQEIQTANDLRDWPAAQHMLLHIADNQIEDARMLYKRLPTQVQEDRIVKAAHILLQTLWGKNYKETYQKLKQEAWPSDLQPLVADIERKFRLKMLDLLSKAYAQIRAEKAAELLGITEQEVLEEAKRLGWEIDLSATFLKVKPREKAQPLDADLSQLQRLSEYVVHLEK